MLMLSLDLVLICPDASGIFSRRKLMADFTLYDPSLTEADPRFGEIKKIPVGTTFEDRLRLIHSLRFASGSEWF